MPATYPDATLRKAFGGRIPDEVDDLGDPLFDVVAPPPPQTLLNVLGGAAILVYFVALPGTARPAPASLIWRANSARSGRGCGCNMSTPTRMSTRSSA